MAKESGGLDKLGPITPKGYEALVKNLGTGGFHKKLSLKAEAISFFGIKALFETYLQLLLHREREICIKQVFYREIGNEIAGYVYVFVQAEKLPAGAISFITIL